MLVECLQLHNSRLTQEVFSQIKVVTIFSTIMSQYLVGERLNREVNIGLLKIVMVLLGENKATLRLQEEVIASLLRLSVISVILLIHGQQISETKQSLMEFV